MIKNITQNHLLLYAYNELDQHDQKAVERALNSDPLIASQYRELSEMLYVMDSYRLSPNPTSLQIILEESSSAIEVH